MAAVSQKKKHPLSESLFSVAVLVSGFLMMCTCYYYSYGNIAPYVISYTRIHSLDPTKGTVTMSESPWLFSGLQFVHGFGFAVGGWLSDNIGPRPTAAVGSVLVTMATLLAAVALQLSYWAVVLALAGIVGVGSSLCYMAVLYTVVQWMPNHSGLATGLVMIGMGSPLVYIPIQTAIINPLNEEPNQISDGFHYFTQEDILTRVPVMFIILSSILVVLQIVSVPFLVEYRDEDPPSERSFVPVAKYIWAVVKPKPFKNCSCLKKVVPPCLQECKSARSSLTSSGASQTSLQLASGGQNSSSCEGTINLSPSQFLRHWEFYVLWFSMFALMFCDACIVAFYKVLGQNMKYDDHTLALIGFFSSLSSSTGRLIWGVLADLMPAKVCLVLVFAGMSSFTYTLQAASLAGAGMYGLWLSVIFGCIGGSFVVLPTFVVQSYGQKHFATNYGLIHTGCALASVASILIPAYGYHFLHWEGMFLMSASLLLLSVAAIIVGTGRSSSTICTCMRRNHDGPQCK